jgi:broad specificity phosphatase PhoE
MRILYVRHGKSMANASATVGVPETPLAEEGLEQARLTGQDLRAENVTAIVCSSYIRAQQTAEIIAAELRIPVHEITVIDELGERRMGELEGKPKLHETTFFYENDSDLNFESHADLIDRVDIALEKVKYIASTTKGTTVVVGHATSGFFFLQVAKGKKLFTDFDPVNQMDNAEFIEVDLAVRKQ